MIAWLNFAALVVASLLILHHCVRSVSPAGRAPVGGPRAYADAGRDRIIASVFELISAAGYVIYISYPLPTPLPRTFPCGTGSRTRITAP